MYYGLNWDVSKYTSLCLSLMAPVTVFNAVLFGLLALGI